MNYTMTLLTQRQEELEQKLLATVSMAEKASIVIALAAWMIIWWISEAVSISVTSLLPLVIFPLFQVMEILK